jgi:hypothetical protein
MLGKLSGKPATVSECRLGQRDSIAKLESLYGGQAVTITRGRRCPWMAGGYVIDVIFDTGPRRLDFVTARLDSMGFRWTGDDWVSVTTRADYAMKLDAMKFEAA